MSPLDGERLLLNKTTAGSLVWAHIQLCALGNLFCSPKCVSQPWNPVAALREVNKEVIYFFFFF